MMNGHNKLTVFLGSYRAEFDKLTRAGKSAGEADKLAQAYGREKVENTLAALAATPTCRTCSSTRC